MKLHFLTLVVMFLCTSLSIHAQEILLNHYRSNTTLLNPAMAGNSESFNINSYFQGSSIENTKPTFTYQTYGLNVDAPVLKLNKYVLSAGYRYYSHISGEAKFKNNGHLISASISRKMESHNVTHQVSIGIEGGVNIRRVNDKDLRWPVQIGPNGFDPSIPTEEVISDIINRDFNLGAQYSITLKNSSKLTLGYGVFHFNRPIFSFLNSDVRENIRTNLYLLVNYKINPKFEILPTFVYMKYGPFDAYQASLGTKYFINPTSWMCLDIGYVKYNQPFVGFSAGIKNLTFFGNYGFVNNASLTKVETGLMYRFVNKSKS